jgi:hypothetical protein
MISYSIFAAHQFNSRQKISSAMARSFLLILFFLLSISLLFMTVSTEQFPETRAIEPLPVPLIPEKELNPSVVPKVAEKELKQLAVATYPAKENKIERSAEVPTYPEEEKEVKQLAVDPEQKAINPSSVALSPEKTMKPSVVPAYPVKKGTNPSVSVVARSPVKERKPLVLEISQKKALRSLKDCKMLFQAKNEDMVKKLIKAVSKAVKKLPKTGKEIDMPEKYLKIDEDYKLAKKNEGKEIKGNPHYIETLQRLKKKQLEDLTNYTVFCKM